MWDVLVSPVSIPGCPTYQPSFPLLLSSLGVLVPARIDGPGRKEEVDTLQADAHLLLPYRETQTQEESDRCEQNVNTHLLADSAAYFGLKSVIDA